ncbi:MAG: RodZ domain-containing protein [Sphingomicrobium sp.]
MQSASSGEVMDEELVDDGQTPMTAGERLRTAREAKGLSIEEIASTTRIPTRHLESIETGDWTKLPAPTYSIGFARNYATAIGLDRDEIGDQLRREMGNTRPVNQPAELFEPADPKRSMPKGLVLCALIALALVAIALTWLSNRDIADDSNAAVNADNSVLADAGVAPIAAAPAVAGPVVITANDAAWIEVRDGTNILKQGELAPGQSFEVPATAAAPTLTTAKPEALRISVGTADAPAVGPAGQKVANVSLKGADLLKGPLASAVAPPPAVAPAPVALRPAPRPTAPKPKTAAAPPPPAAAPTPAPAAATTNTGA